MNPLELMNNDVATLRMSSEKVFELWNDSVSERMKNHCLDMFHSRWNSYMSQMNTRLNQYMIAEREVTRMVKMINELLK